MTIARAINCAIPPVLLLALGGCSSNYVWGWQVIMPTTAQGRRDIEFLMSGLSFTVLLAVTAICISVLLGLGIALPGLSKVRQMQVLSRAYVETFRSVPILVMLLWVYYGLPVLLNIRLDEFSAGVVTLAICDSAFEAEIFRAGIQSIEKGQIEAASSLGLSYFLRLRFIVLPQAIRRVLPALGNQFIYMLKTLSLVSVIGLAELTRRANELVVTVYRPLEVYTFLVLEYLVLILLASSGMRWIERRMTRHV